MENATKALLIAAAILIAIVVITLGVFVLGKGSELVKENSDMSDVEISTYNSKFEAYCGSNIRGAQVKQLINAVNQHNNSNKEDLSKNIALLGADLDFDSVRPSTVGDNFQYKSTKIMTGYSYNVSSDTGAGGLIDKITIKQNTK